MIIFNLLITPSAMAFNAEVKSTYSYDNNVFKTKGNKSSSNLMIVSPQISAQLPYKNYAFSGDYGLKYGRYFEESGQDYLKQRLSLNLMSDAQAKYSGALGYAYSSSLDARGETAGFTTEAPDVWASNSFNSLMMYRTDDRKASYSLNVTGTKKRFSVDKSKIKDADSFLVELNNNLRLTGRSKANFSIKGSSTKFVGSNSKQFDSFDMRYLVGLSWIYSGKVDASASIGWNTRRIVASGDQVFSGAIAQLNILWAMKSYSQYNLSMGRTAKSSPVIGATNSITNSFKLTWSHVFTRKVSTLFGFNVALTQSNTGQTDTLSTFSSSMSYKAARQLTVAPQLIWSAFKSTESGQKYDNYVASLLFTWAYSR